MNTDFPRPIQWHIVHSAHLSTCGRCFTKYQKAPEHLENSFCHYDKSMFCHIMLNQSMNQGTSLRRTTSYDVVLRKEVTRFEYLSARGICSTKNQKAPQHLENRFCHCYMPPTRKIEPFFGLCCSTISQILRGAILVVMTTKFETKSAITRFVHVYYEI